MSKPPISVMQMDVSCGILALVMFNIATLFVLLAVASTLIGEHAMNSQL